MFLSTESLDLRGVWLRDSSRESFVSGIRKLRRLRKLSIPYVANDELLAALAKVGYLQGDPSAWLKPPVDLYLGCSAILPGQYSVFESFEDNAAQE